jgi:hypothetical protein
MLAALLALDVPTVVGDVMLGYLPFLLSEN